LSDPTISAMRASAVAGSSEQAPAPLLLPRAPLHAHRGARLGEEGEDQEAVADRDRLERTEVGQHHAAVEARVGPRGVAERLVLLPHPRRSLCHRGQRQHLGDRLRAHGRQQLVEVLAQAAEPRARVEREPEQDVAGGRDHVLDRELRRVEPVGLGHQRLVARELRVLLAVVLVDEVRGARRLAVAALEAGGRHRLGVGQQVVVEPHRARGVVGQVGQDVARADREAAVAHFLRVAELDRVDRLALGEQHGAGEAVEVGPGDESHRKE